MSEFYLFDVGSRDGVAERWHEVDKEIHVIGFEPDPEECEIRNGNSIGTPFLSEKHYPIALSGFDGARRFYRTRSPALSGFYKPIKETFERFSGDPDRADILDSTMIHARGLTSFCIEHKIWPTFLKLDAQGAEFDIISTLHKMDEILGIEIELQVLPLYEGRFTNFTQPAAFLEISGFEPWWFKPIYWTADHGGYIRISHFDALYINKRSKAMDDPRMELVLRAYDKEIGA